MPTSRVSQEYIELRQSIVKLLELQQQLKKKQTELRTLSTQKLQTTPL